MDQINEAYERSFNEGKKSSYYISPKQVNGTPVTLEMPNGAEKEFKGPDNRAFAQAQTAAREDYAKVNKVDVKQVKIKRQSKMSYWFVVWH